MWKTVEQRSDTTATAFFNCQQSVAHHVQDQEEALAKLNRQKNKIQEVMCRYGKMEEEVQLWKEEVRRVTMSFNKANERITELQTKLKYEQTQRSHSIISLERQNMELKDSIRRLDMQVQAKEQQINVLSLYKREGQDSIASLRKQLDDRIATHREDKAKITKMNQLLERQASLLQSQDQEFQELLNENERLQSLIQEREDINEQKYKVQHYINEMNGHFMQLTRKLSKHSEDWQVLMELQKIRLKMRQLATGEVEKISDLVRSFE